MLKRMLQGPRTNEFYELLAAGGANALAAAKAAESRFRDYPGGVGQDEIKELEHAGDRITGELIGLINSSFITPFDRDDLFVLAGAIDDVTDAIENATELLGLYDVEQPTRQSIEHCAILVAAVTQLDALLRNLKGKRGSSPEIAEIKRLEDEGDLATRRAVGGLFEDERIDPLIVIRWKEIYESLEEAIDAVETAAHRIGNILVKNA
jgi:predicted phosphate transport protein (TIGR00153 family)